MNVNLMKLLGTSLELMKKPEFILTEVKVHPKFWHALIRENDSRLFIEFRPDLTPHAYFFGSGQVPFIVDGTIDKDFEIIGKVVREIPIKEGDRP